MDSTEESRECETSRELSCETENTPNNTLETEINNKIVVLYREARNGCAHSRKNQFKGSEYVCDDIMKLTIHAMDNNIFISQDNMCTFYRLIGERKYNTSSCCIQYNTIDIIEFTNKLFKYQLPSLDTLKYVLKYSIFDSCITNLTENKNFCANSEMYINYILRNRLSELSDQPEDSILSNFVTDNIKITPNNLIELCGCKNIDIIDKIAIFVDNTINGYLSGLFGGTYPLCKSTDLMKAVCKNLPCTKNVLIALLHKNFQISDDNFMVVCKQSNFQGMKLLLELSRITITSVHFKTLLKNLRTHNYSRKQNEITTTEIQIEQQKMELFFQNGFVPNTEDIMTSIYEKIEIPQIERFNVKLSEVMLTICMGLGFYPKYNFESVTAEMYQLQGACREKNFPCVKKLIKEYKLVPDKICMENMAAHKENVMLSYLVEAGGVITLNCINIRLKQYKSGKYLSSMIDIFEKQNTLEKNNYIKRIEELEKKLETLVTKNESNSEIKNESNNEIKNNVLTIDVSDENIINCKKKYKNIRVPHKNMLTFFGIDKTHKMTYTAFKILLTRKIKNESWVEEDGTTLIYIPSQYKKCFGSVYDTNENFVISFDDIDKLIYLFYKNCYE